MNFSDEILALADRYKSLEGAIGSLARAILESATQAPCNPLRSSPGLVERPDSPNAMQPPANAMRPAGTLDETDSVAKPALADPEGTPMTCSDAKEAHEGCFRALTAERQLATVSAERNLLREKSFDDELEMSALRVERYRLARDAERLDWMESQRANCLHIEVGYTGSFSGANLVPFATVFIGCADGITRDNVRAAIDAALPPASGEW